MAATYRKIFAILFFAAAAIPALAALPAVLRAQTPPAAASAAATATVKAEQDVRQAERDRFAAMVKADAGALDRLLAPELIYTHSNAQIQDKAGFIGDIKSGAIKYLSVDPSETNVRVFGSAAIVTGAAALHVIQNGTDLDIKIRYTNTQINRNGSWQMVAWEATRLPQ
jgi:Domain of unknown function (DUF4440)